MEKVFDKLRQWEGPFSPKKSDVLKKVVVKFKSKVMSIKAFCVLIVLAIRSRGPVPPQPKVR